MARPRRGSTTLTALLVLAAVVTGPSFLLPSSHPHGERQHASLSAAVSGVAGGVVPLVAASPAIAADDIKLPGSLPLIIILIILVILATVVPSMIWPGDGVTGADVLDYTRDDGRKK
eukprot:gb/GFBE01020940.1/.p1 GENE.gb/GFBE01020940.1/~~gb/GFBE01020940.1/.p1  ORF type:complete len:117 (+),score=12.15 gb/GFBE01020940.1/:1-351(+)